MLFQSNVYFAPAPVPEPNDGSTLDFVNLGTCDAGGNSVSTYYGPDTSKCGEAGTWYCEDTPSGRAIQLCDATCGTVSISGSQLYFSLGCQRVEGPPE